MRTVKITLGEKEYTIRERKSRQNAEWRRRLAEPFGELTEKLSGAGDVDITSREEVSGLIGSVTGLLFHSIDTVADLLFDYAPDLRAKKEEILDEAYDSEIVEAFLKVLGLAYPFGSALSQVKRLVELGSQSDQTSPS
jgi:hypothetical protein